jgi:cell division septum initiation protein DivIVA
LADVVALAYTEMVTRDLREALRKTQAEEERLTLELDRERSEFEQTRRDGQAQAARLVRTNATLRSQVNELVEANTALRVKLDKVRDQVIRLLDVVDNGFMAPEVRAEIIEQVRRESAGQQ